MKHQLKIITILFLMIITVATFSTLPAMSGGTEQSEKEAMEKFRQAKKFIYSKEWKKAVEGFGVVVKTFSGSEYADDSLYWMAYSLDKMGRDIENAQENLEMRNEALKHLAELMARYPSSKWFDDAKRLTFEIAGELAAKGLKRFEKVILNGVKDDQEAEIKIMALLQLFDMDKEKAFAVAEKIIRAGKNLKLREKAIFAVGQQQDPRAVSILVEVAEKDSDKKIRENAVFWLGQIGTPESFKQLLKLYHKTTDIELKKRLLFSLSQSDNKDAVKELIRIYKKETNTELKKQIIFELGNGDSKEARDFILEILE